VKVDQPFGTGTKVITERRVPALLTEGLEWNKEEEVESKVN